MQVFLQENCVALCVGAAALIGASSLFAKKRLDRDCKDFEGTNSALQMLNNSDSVLKKDQVKGSINEYYGMFSGARSGACTEDSSVTGRREKYNIMVNHFYNLVTDFYEWGWGQSFHFGPRVKNETFIESIKRAEYHLCSRLGLKPGLRALDVGCGVGGPMRNMAIFSGAQIDGITINEYQVKVGTKYNSQLGLDKQCKLTQGDFQNLPWAPDTFDRAFAIEATCHSPNKTVTFSQVGRVLKAGGLFAGYEWVVLPERYDEGNRRHVAIKEGIEEGNSLPTLATPQQVLDALEQAGFEVLDHYDANIGAKNSNQIPWYATLEGSSSLSGFRMTWLGRCFTHALVVVLETLHIAPAGSIQVSKLLNDTALDLVAGGREGIFTPSYFFIARKK